MNPPTAHRRSRAEWRASAPLALLMLATVGCHFSFGIFFTPLLEELQSTRASVSSIFSLYMAVYVVAQVCAGALSDRLGPPLVIGVSGIVFASGFVGMSFIQASWQAYLCYGMLIAFGFAGTYVPAIAAAGHLQGSSEAAGVPFGTVLGVVTAGSGLGILVVGVLADQMLQHQDVRSAYRVLGLACAMTTTLLTVWLYRRKRATLSVNQPVGREGERWQGTTLRQVVLQPRAWVLVLANTGLNISVGTYTVHGVASARVAGLSAGLAGAGLFCAGAGRVVGSLAAGRVAYRVNPVRQWQAYAGMIAISMLWMASPAGALDYFFACTVFGLGFGGSTVAFPLLVAKTYGQQRLGGIFGFINLGYGVGGALGPLAAGLLFDLEGSYWPGFLVAACSAVAAVICITAARSTSSSLP